MADVSDVPQQSCPACGTIVNVQDLEPLVNVACPACGAKFRVERAFDNFVVVETLGVGGMGSVYKARDTRLDRFVALKLLRKELSTDPAEAARLEQEARVTAAVNHPNVIQVYSTGTDHDQIYLVMELVDHGSLDDLMAQTPRVPEAQVLATGIQVAKGLQAAHQKGLIHRDVKPANILFSDAQTAKVGDFGLAVVAEQKAEMQQEIWGTPYYVAPERLNNEPEDLRSDIYSLGATLFHALAGRPPIEGESTSATELRRLKSEPPDLRRVAPDVSRETARVISKMLAPNAADRYATYGELITDLEAAGGLGSGAAKPRASRLPWIIAAAALVLLAAAALFFLKRAERQTESAPQAAQEVAAIEARYQQARQQLIGGNYSEAATSFNQLAADAQNRQPLLNWIRMHAGLAALLDGKLAAARENFSQIERGGLSSKASADAELARFFVDSSRALATAEPVAPGAFAGMNANGAGSFALFAGSLKNWQLKRFEDAAPLLEAFANSAPAGNFSWINEYKPIAAKYLADHRAYTTWAAGSSRLETVADTRAAIEKLRAVEKKLQTKGPLADVVKVDLKRLTGEAAARDKTEKTARAAEDQRLLAEQTPVWETALAEARGQIAEYDFAAALTAIDGAPVTAPQLKAAQADEQKKAAWLQKWKTTLMHDINAGRFKAPIKVGTAAYTGAGKATDSRITFLLPPYGMVEVEWPKVPADALLQISRSLIPQKGGDAAERQWLSAVFAAVTGQSDAARELSDAAVKAKPELATERKLLIPPKP